MTYIKRTFIIFIYIMVDIIAIGMAIYLACYVRSSTLSFEVNGFNLFLNDQNHLYLVFSFWWVVTILTVSSKSLYKTRREMFEVLEIGKLLRAVMIASITVIMVIYGLNLEYFPRSVLVLGTIFIFCFLTIWRILKRMFVGFLVANGYNNFNVLIVGKGNVGMFLLRQIQIRRRLGLNVVGFLDDFKKSVDSCPKEERVLGGFRDFLKVVRKEFVDQIFITVYEMKDFPTLIAEARKQGIAVKVIPQGFHLISGECFRYNIGIIPILEYSQGFPLVRQVGKRIFDFLLTVPVVVLLLPIYGVIALLIKVDSKGPVLYLSQRYGRNGRKFNMLKFRSMNIDSDERLGGLEFLNESDGPIFKMKNDPRTTNIGKYLRKYSLDELPQLFNVISGTMSLVGPRPLPIDQIRKEDFRQLKRLDVRPGVTGLWQIRGRSDISFARLVKWDMWYIKNWSLWLDLNILFSTIPVVIKGQGAY